mgnify:CR=1 FL=1
MDGKQAQILTTPDIGEESARTTHTLSNTKLWFLLRRVGQTTPVVRPGLLQDEIGQTLPDQGFKLSARPPEVCLLQADDKVA